MAGKWWFKPQKEIKELLEKHYDSSRFLDQTIATDRVYEKILVIKDNVAEVMLYEYIKIDYGTGYKINHFKGE